MAIPREDPPARRRQLLRLIDKNEELEIKLVRKANALTWAGRLDKGVDTRDELRAVQCVLRELRDELKGINVD